MISIYNIKNQKKALKALGGKPQRTCSDFVLCLKKRKKKRVQATIHDPENDKLKEAPKVESATPPIDNKIQEIERRF